MDYPFQCKGCKKITLAPMTTQFYTSKKYECPFCGEELERVVTNTILIDKTEGFYRKIE